MTGSFEGKGFSLLDKLVLVSVRYIITFFYNNNKIVWPSAKTLAAFFVQGQLDVSWPLLLFPHTGVE